MDIKDQLAIAKGMHEKCRDFQELNESMQNWEQTMKKDDQKRKAINAQLDQSQNREDSSEATTNEARASQYEHFKAKGNDCFKRGNFADAIEFYSKAQFEAASNLDISILYSNRAFCQIKLRQFAGAVQSCDKAVELDASNEKAFYRRMLAHEELKNLPQALADGQRVLKLNPKNVAALKIVDKLLQLNVKVPVERVYASTLDGLGEDVHYVDKPPHLQAPGALKRITIAGTTKTKKTPVDRDMIVDKKQVKAVCADDIDMSFIEKSDNIPEEHNKQQVGLVSSTSFQKNTKELENSAIKSDQQLSRPHTSSEFNREWVCKRSIDERFSYLKIIPAEDLAKLIGSQLDSKMLSEMLQVLAIEFVRHDIAPMDYLLQLTKCSGLSILSLMMGTDDRRALEEIIAYTKCALDNTLKHVSKAFSV